MQCPRCRQDNTGHAGQVIRGRDRLEEQTRHRLPPDRAALLLAGLLVARRRAQRADTARTRVKVTEVLAHSVGLAISPAVAAAILRQDLKLTVIRADGRQNYVVGLTPAVIGALWAQLR